MSTPSTEFRIARLSDRQVHARVLGFAREEGVPVFEHTLLFGQKLSSNPEDQERLQLILDQEIVGIQQFRFEFPSGLFVKVARDGIRNGCAWLPSSHRDLVSIEFTTRGYSNPELCFERFRNALGAARECHQLVDAKTSHEASCRERIPFSLGSHCDGQPRPGGLALGTAEIVTLQRIEGKLSFFARS